MKAQNMEKRKRKKMFVAKFAQAIHECLFAWDSGERMEWNKLTENNRQYYIFLAQHLSNKFMVKFREAPPEQNEITEPEQNEVTEPEQNEITEEPEQNEVTEYELAEEIYLYKSLDINKESWLKMSEIYRVKRVDAAKKLLSLLKIEHREKNKDNGMEGLYRLLLPNGFHQKNSEEWLRVQDYARKVGVSEVTLYQLRSCTSCQKTDDLCFGRDKRGHVWTRRSGGNTPVFYYLGEYTEVVTWCCGEDKRCYELNSENPL